MYTRIILNTPVVDLLTGGSDETARVAINIDTIISVVDPKGTAGDGVNAMLVLDAPEGIPPLGVIETFDEVLAAVDAAFA